MVSIAETACRRFLWSLRQAPPDRDLLVYWLRDTGLIVAILDECRRIARVER